MSNPFIPRRPLLRYLLLGVGGLCLVVVAGLIVQTVRAPRPPSDLRPPVAAAPPGSVTGVGPEGRPAGGRTGPLRTLPGDRTVEEVPVGYPHTPVGAVSAAVHYWSQLASTLDVGRAATIAGVVADPAWSMAVSELERGRVETRRRLGIPESGPVPDGASVLFTPLMYQVRNVHDDAMDVLLLGYYEEARPGTASSTSVIVFPTKIRWVDGDWRLPAQTLEADYTPLMAKPGTTDAADKGWQPLNI